eukprot:TRINITY_DN11305_c0_g1_i1.p1 TRINITY_DN11305_c0_g1~~TRINITY_DN11305_c0_g1_i1.p1  ORF type:complete len:121 (+),score=30.76 TRINITY_DN11305_c0_g1_i1:67-429(+)
MCIRDRSTWDYIFLKKREMLPRKGTKEIFRDCLKLVPKMIENKEKVAATRLLIVREFRKNKDIADETTVEALRMNAIRGISNYLVFTAKDEYMKNKSHYDRMQHPQTLDLGDEHEQQRYR